nr:unnamed protein product [Digitaria exilis]
MSYSRGSRSVESSDAENPGNNLYVTGLSARVTDRDLEKHFSTEGEVIDASVVHDPWTRESRGFGFVTMATVKQADRCLKYLDRSVLEAELLSVLLFVEDFADSNRVDICNTLSLLLLMSKTLSYPVPVTQAKRRRGRTPTPGKYLGTKSSRGK